MRVVFAVIVLVLLALITVRSKQPIAQNNQAVTEGDHSERAEQSKPVNGVTVSHSSNQPALQEKETQKQNIPESDVYSVKVVSQAPNPTDPWFITSVCVTGALALISVGTLIVFWRQTEAIMQAERAWILIDWDDMIHINPSAPAVLSHCFCCYVKNVGKSPAFLEKIYLRFIRLNNLDELPSEPDYSVDSPRDVSSESEPVLPDKRFGQVYQPLESKLSYEVIDAEHRSKKCVLYAYGFVRYRDVYGRPCETRFGLAYQSAPTPRMSYDRFIIAGPKSYNRYTRKKVETLSS